MGGGGDDDGTAEGYTGNGGERDGDGQAVPRIRGEAKSGMMETLCEQLIKVARENNGTRTPPHFTYASSWEVYGEHRHENHNHDKATSDNNTKRIVSEIQPVYTTSSLRGASKLLDEILAKTYHARHDLYSVGLRFFHVYGPWGLPGISTYEMAERAISNPSVPILRMNGGGGVNDDARRGKDYIHVDDAVDAIMSAMQFRPWRNDRDGMKSETSTSTLKNPPPSMIINVGSGVASTLEDLARIMESYFPRSEEDATVDAVLERIRNNGVEDVDEVRNENEGKDERRSFDDTEYFAENVSIVASTERAKALLGFQTRVSVEQGILDLLSWHYDHSTPYGANSADGSDDNQSIHHNKDRSKANEGKKEQDEDSNVKDNDNANNNSDNGDNDPRREVIRKGMAGCSSPLDEDCLRGATVFPCASECSNPKQCIPTPYDSVATVSRIITNRCEEVMYTINLSDDLVSIPSATATIGSDSVLYTGIQDSVSNSEDKEIAMKIGGLCNIAFVSEGSVLVQELKRKRGISNNFNMVDELLTRFLQGDGDQEVDLESYLLTHGFWTLLMVTVSSSESEVFSWGVGGNTPRIEGMEPRAHVALDLLPKLSPEFFFSPDTKYAVYCDPDIVFTNITGLIYTSQMSPGNGGKVSDGKRDRVNALNEETGFTVMMVPEFSRSDTEKTCEMKHSHPSSQGQGHTLQKSMYDTIRIGLQGQLIGGGIDPIMKTSWIVHYLPTIDARLLRCDVYAEVVGWNVTKENRSMEFIFGLHDLWSRVFLRWSNKRNWWTLPKSKQEKSNDLKDLYTPPKIDNSAGLWMGVLSSAETQSLVRIIPSSAVLAFSTEDSSHC